MSFLKSLFSKTQKLTATEILEKLSSFVAIEGNLVTPETKAAILLSPDDQEVFNNFCSRVTHMMDQLEDPPKFTLNADDHGTKWIILEKYPFQSLVKTVDRVSAELSIQKVGDRMIAAIFKGRFKKEDTYWICNYRTSNFYPFVPQKETESNKDHGIPEGSRIRNHEKEMELGKLFKLRGLPVEAPENWFALWDAPF